MDWLEMLVVAVTYVLAFCAGRIYEDNVNRRNSGKDPYW